MACIDGDVHDSEREQIRRAGSGLGSASDELFVVAEGRRPQDLALVFAVLWAKLASADREPLIKLCIAVVLADGYLRYTDLVALELVADVLELGRSGLRNVFHDITGRMPPQFGDMSSAGDWMAR
jgi:uncharacterized tellurite resistance protein B-like protein